MLAQLTTTLTTAPLGLPTDDATALLAQAVEQQILVSELEPALTGGLPLDALIELLGNDHQRPHIYDQLVRVRSQLHRLNAAPLGSDRVDYLEIAKDLPPTHDTAARPPFHVDLYKPQTVSTLGRSVVSEIIRGAQILERISGRRANNAMRLFRDAFSRRYEGREVALTEALDPELGIGFDAPIGDDADAIIEDLPFLPERIPIAWSERDAFLMRRLHRVWEEREYELTLNANDVEALTAFAGGDRLPYAFSVSATIGASSQAALDRGEFCIRLDACTGPSGARFLGRFCHGDAKLANVVGQHLRAEEAGDPGACFAEIVHLPQSRFGNFLCRPVLREYEIPLLGRSGAATDKQLPIADLLVSVIDDRVALRSRKLGREVIPRLTTAHAYDLENLPTYRFLCALQDQGVNTGRWSWGALEGAPFLPRVVSGKVVLSRATWTFDAGECASLAKLHGGRLWMAVQEIRLKRRLPKWVALRHGDNELLVDFDNILTLEALSHELKDYSHAMIVEMLPDPQDLIATGEDGHFVHELILPFVRPAPKVPPKPYVRPSRNPPFEERAFAPGSEWIYAKVYAGTLSVDQLLCDVVHPLVRKATADGTIDKWFFVRYADPDWHVRLRFRSEKNCQGVFVSVLQRALDRHLKAGRAWRIQFDTYDREVESYGGSTASMQLAETIFHGDSEAVISLLKLLRQAESPVLRWHLAFCGVDLLLSDLGLDVAGKDRVTSRLMHRLRRQFQSNKNVDRQLSARFRVERPALEKLLGSTCAGRVGTLDSSPDRLGIDEPSISIFRARSHIVRSASRQLRSLEALGKLNRNVESLAMQFVHMHVNRLVRSSVAAHEFVLYDFLGRIYRSEQAKNRVSVTRT